MSKSRIVLVVLGCLFISLLGWFSLSAQGTKAAPAWIWMGTAQPEQTVYFRKDITLKYRVTSARLYGACDNQMTVYINGKEIIRSDSWETPVFREITDAFANPTKTENPVRNVIAVKAHNSDGPAGLLLRLVLENSKKETITLTTDGSWRVSERAGEAWNTVDFDDSAWAKASVVGKLGGAPWTTVTETSLQGTAKFKKPTATPVELIKVKKDFKVELLYSVPRETQGSWVNMTVDPKGRLITSDQYGKLYRVTPPGPGAAAPGLSVEELPVELGEAHGLCWAFDSLYVVVNEGRKYKPRGLWRVTSSKNNDVLDKKELLREMDGSGEHGPHAVIPGPDGKSLYVLHGNHTAPVKFQKTTVPPIWGEDFLVPRLWDASGHAVGKMAPAGCIYKTDKDGKEWTLISIGYRNQFDMAFNQDGELFTYDSDMEWDMNLPWYRPTRVCHAVPGSEFGWRGGTGKMYEYHPDNLPPVVNVGPGSPCGITFGYGARFPGKYQNALYLCDWSYGKLYACHMTPDGASYKGELEEFLIGSPLPLTDVVINPKDGAMYFTIGGRNTMSGLYRVTYVGKELKEAQPDLKQRTAIQLLPSKLINYRLSSADVQSVIDRATKEKLSLDELAKVIVGHAPDKTPIRLGDVAVIDFYSPHDQRAIRKKIESYYGNKDRDAIDAAWPYLGHEDRFLRYAARTVLEFQDPSVWAGKALDEKNSIALTHAVIGLTRTGGKPLLAGILQALERVDWSKLSDAQKIDYLRAYQLAFIRMGAPEAVLKEKVGKRLDAWYPAASREVNAELSKLISYLEVPGGVAKTLDLMRKAPTQEEQIEYALGLRTVKTGWTMKGREEYFHWFHKAMGYRGGNSFHKFLANIRTDAIKWSLNDDERAQLKAVLAKTPAPVEPKFAFKQRPFVKKYSVDELVPAVEKGLTGRNYANGRNLFGEAKCFACHRFNNEGGGTGPDLTQVVGRFGPRDLLEALIEPSKVVSDQYAAIVVTTTDGRQVVGRVVNLAGDGIMINTDMLDPNKLTNVNRKLIDTIGPSPLSMMPEGLLDTLSRDDVLDLIAYLYSRGDPNHASFRKQ